MEIPTDEQIKELTLEIRREDPCNLMCEFCGRGGQIERSPAGDADLDLWMATVYERTGICCRVSAVGRKNVVAKWKKISTAALEEN